MDRHPIVIHWMFEIDAPLDREGQFPHESLVGRRGLEPRTYGLKVRSSTIELATRPDQATCTAYAAFAALTYQ